MRKRLKWIKFEGWYNAGTKERGWEARATHKANGFWFMKLTVEKPFIVVEVEAETLDQCDAVAYHALVGLGFDAR